MRFVRDATALIVCLSVNVTVLLLNLPVVEMDQRVPLSQGLVLGLPEIALAEWHLSDQDSGLPKRGAQGPFQDSTSTLWSNSFIETAEAKIRSPTLQTTDVIIC